MRYQPKEKKTMIVITCVVLAVLLLSQLLGFANTESAHRLMYVGKEGKDHWSARYALLDGKMAKTIHAFTTPDILHVDVTTESGQISITVIDREDNVVFHQENIPTSSFDVDIPDDVRVCVTADSHKGSFYIRTKELTGKITASP